MIALLLLLAAPEEPATLVARATAMTSAAQHCTPSSDSTDITVCGLRQADRFRVPLVVHDPGDPRYESVAAERHRLLARTTPVQDMGPFLVGGGMAGVTVTSGGGSTTAGGYRKLAP